LKDDDLWELDRYDEAQYNYTRFRYYWDLELKRWRYVHRFSGILLYGINVILQLP
jgi:hypothetical protein